MRSLAFLLLLIMLFSGVSCGYNLILGGINQSEPCVEPCSSAANDDYKEIAASLDAYYFPMYYKDLGSNIEEVRKAALGEASEQNGLENGALKNHHYETIVAYSGGTSTAVTALADKTKYGLTCDKLVLVSPMAAGIRLDMPETSGASPEGDLVIDILQIAADIENAKLYFKKQVDEIRANNPNIKIIVIQSPDDKPSLLSDTYQYWFDGKDPGIEVYEADLTKTGEEAHKEIFFNYAASHLANDGSGIKFSPTGQSTKPNPFEQGIANREPKFPTSSQPSETIVPVAADVRSIGTQISGTKFEDWGMHSNLYTPQGGPFVIYSPTNSPSSSQPAPITSTTVQDSESSVIGTWNIIWDTPTPAGAIPFVVMFYSDGTMYEPAVNGPTYSGESCTGTWEQNGNNVHWTRTYSKGSTAFEGTIQTNSMTGTARGYAWSAERAPPFEQGIGNREPQSLVSNQSSEATPIAVDDHSINFKLQDPIKSEEWNSRGIALLNQGNYKEAFKAFTEAISFDANNTVAWKNYWNIYFGNYDQEQGIA